MVELTIVRKMFKIPNISTSLDLIKIVANIFATE